MIEIVKADWEQLKTQLEMQHKNMLLAQAQDEELLKLCDLKISEFPEEDPDPMPEEVKGIVGKKDE